MKRITALFLAVIFIMSMFVGVSADTDRVFEKEQTYAQGLYELGLFLGTESGFELDRALTRTEAIVMMIRTLGRAEEAEACEKTHPFTDVDTWADGYVSYAYDMGLTKGVSDNLFGAEEMVESNMYLTFILRAMGYTDGENADFIWQMPYALASELEMLPTVTDLKNFVRADMVTFTTAALFAKCKDTDTYLYEKLIEEGVFTKEQWNNAFAEDPFSEYKTQNRVICEAQQEESGETDNNQYTFYNHILIDVSEKEHYAEAVVLTHHAGFTVQETNEIIGNGAGSGMHIFLLDKNTWAIIGKEQRGYNLSDLFPESALGSANNLVWRGMNMRLGVSVSKIIASGALAFKPLSYGQALADFTEDKLYSIEDRIETEQCTVLAGYLAGVPHGPSGFIYLIYKPGSEMGEGKVVKLPLPQISVWGATELPEQITLSEDGKTLSYSFCFDSDLAFEIDGEFVRLVHEAGTYNYKSNLITGETELDIVKE